MDRQLRLWGVAHLGFDMQRYGVGLGADVILALVITAVGRDQNVVAGSNTSIPDGRQSVVRVWVLRVEGRTIPNRPIRAVTNGDAAIGPDGTGASGMNARHKRDS